MPITDVFASNVFDEAKMKEYLAKDTFQEMEKTIREGKPLNPKIAEAVAIRLGIQRVLSLLKMACFVFLLPSIHIQVMP